MVDVGRIHEVYARVQGPIYDLDGVHVVGAAAEHHAAQTQLADLDPGPPKLPVLHRITPCTSPQKRSLLNSQYFTSRNLLPHLEAHLAAHYGGLATTRLRRAGVPHRPSGFRRA